MLYHRRNKAVVFYDVVASHHRYTYNVAWTPLGYHPAFSHPYDSFLPSSLVHLVVPLVPSLVAVSHRFHLSNQEWRF